MTIATKTVTIASGASLSGAVDLRMCKLVGIIVPAAWTAAGISFQVSADDTTYADLFNISGGYKITSPAVNTQYILNPLDTAGIRFLKVRSGLAGAAVNQGADRVITLVYANQGC